MGESRRITRKSASNLALSFIMLPRDQRDAMSVLYAFCREVDDVADEDSCPVDQRRKELRRWREDIRVACGAGIPEIEVNRELKPLISRYHLPLDLFEALLDGVETDLDKKRYADWNELDLYCYRVASVVGLLSIRIFGRTNAACEQYAVCLGKALQLTNILRDVQTDAARDRIYIPQSELRRFEVTESEILEGRWSARYENLAEAVADRAQGFYAEARRALPSDDQHSMIAAELMAAVYWKLLSRLQRLRFNVFGPSAVRLSKPAKAAIVLRAWAAFRLFGRLPAYGTPR